MNTVEREKTNESKKNRKLILLLLLLLLLLLISIGVTIWALFFRGPTVVLNPDYAPEEVEFNQVPIPNDDAGGKADNAAGGGSVSLNYAAQVIIDLSDGKAGLYFANPGKSNQDMVIQMVIQDEVLVQSGRLTPGHQVTELELLPDAAKKLAPGGYDGKFILYYYHPETMEKAMVNTEIEIDISVQE